MNNIDVESGYYIGILRKYPDEKFKIKVEYRGENRSRITFPNGTPTIDECGYTKIWYFDEFILQYELLEFITK